MDSKFLDNVMEQVSVVRIGPDVAKLHPRIGGLDLCNGLDHGQRRASEFAIEEGPLGVALIGTSVVDLINRMIAPEVEDRAAQGAREPDQARQLKQRMRGQVVIELEGMPIEVCCHQIAVQREQRAMITARGLEQSCHGAHGALIQFRKADADGLSGGRAGALRTRRRRGPMR